MDSNLEFRVILFYLAALYLFPLIRWRKSRRSPSVVGVHGSRQQRARLVAKMLFIVPLANFVIGGPGSWFFDLDLPNSLRWFMTVPATLAILLLFWACRFTEGVRGFDEAFVDEGPYQWLRHPQLLASSVFFFSMAILASNGVILLATGLGVALLRLVVAPAMEADLEQKYGLPFRNYRQRTGSFFVPLRRLPKAKYTVPRRFGLSSVIALTTIFAMLFGSLNFMRAAPVDYLFLSLGIAAVCLVQIVFVSIARIGSALTGTIMLPVWASIRFSSELHRASTAENVIWCVFAIFLGTLVGYCIGGLAAGFFLILDMIEPYLPGAKQDSMGAMAVKTDQNPS